MTITDEQRSDAYPAATMETANSSNEELLYNHPISTRSDLPCGYPIDSYTSPNNKVAKVDDGRRMAEVR